MHTYIHVDIIYIYVYMCVVCSCVCVCRNVYIYFLHPICSVPLENPNAIIWYHILGTFGLG